MIEYNELIQRKAELNALINLIPYDGTPERKCIDGKDYIYIRKRVGSKITSKYVDIYSDELFVMLQNQNKQLRIYKKELRSIEKQLAKMGYTDESLDSNVIINLDFARASMKRIIYDQAILEGVSTTFPQTEEIIENGNINGMKADDVLKILNLKHAWKFILDKDILSYPTSFDVLSHIAKLVNEGFYTNGGNVRTVPVTIGGSTYVPPLPIESVIKESIKNIISSKKKVEIKAVELCLYCMKSQIFIDGNKRASVIFANHYLISNGKGLLIIDEENISDFKRRLIAYYEGKDKGETAKFLLEKCYVGI